MRKNIDLPEYVVDVLKKEAAENSRVVKKQIEHILIQHVKNKKNGR